jgi:hypothetical protein
MRAFIVSAIPFVPSCLCSFFSPVEKLSTIGTDECFVKVKWITEVEHILIQPVRHSVDITLTAEKMTNSNTIVHLELGIVLQSAEQSWNF